MKNALPYVKKYRKIICTGIRKILNGVSFDNFINNYFFNGTVHIYI